MTPTSTPEIDIASIVWMPPRATALASPLPRSGKRGRPTTDNDLMAALRCHYPTIVNQHPGISLRQVHIYIGQEMRRQFRAHHCNRLGITDDCLIIGNPSYDSSPSRYVNSARPDQLLGYLIGADVKERSAPRADTGKCACGNPLHLTSRNYCKACKTALNRTTAKARKTPAVVNNNRAADTTAQSSTQPKRANRQHAERLVEPMHEHDARPVAIPVITTVVDRDEGVDRQILIIDDRHGDRTERRLTDTNLIELARQSATVEFTAMTAGTIFHPTALTTDVALAVRTTTGIVVWVGQANATNPLANPATHALPRLGVKIRELLDPTTKARVTEKLTSDLIKEASKLIGHDAATISDAYELYERARQQPRCSFTSILELIKVHVPRTDEGWAVANKLHEATPDLPHAHAIDAAAMLVGDST